MIEVGSGFFVVLMVVIIVAAMLSLKDFIWASLLLIVTAWFTIIIGIYTEGVNGVTITVLIAAGVSSVLLLSSIAMRRSSHDRG